MKKRNRRLLVLMSLALLGTAAVVGCHDHGHRFFNPDRVRQMVDWKVDDVLDSIDATPDQRAQIEAIVDQLMDEGQALHQEMQSSHAEIVQEWLKDQPDTQKIFDLVDANAETKAVFAKKVAQALLDVQAILTPEQRSLIAAHIEEKMGHGGLH